MKRRSAPPLYELIRTRSGERVPPREPEAPRRETIANFGAPLTSLAGTWLSPGRSVQFPVGYLFVAGAAVLVVVCVAYMVGHHRGERSGRIISEDVFQTPALVAGDGRLPRDPLEQPRAVSPREPQPRTASPPPRQTGGTWGDIQSDPRERGKMYFVLAETREAGAVRLAEFCRERGLETYVVPGNNPNLRRVIALPGFPPAERTSSNARSLERLIHSIGDSWKNQEPGATNLRDAYAVQFGQR